MRRLLALLMILIPLAGCGSERIPTYPLMSPADSLKILAERSHAIKTVSAQGRVTLTRKDGNSIRLDAALVMRLPDAARVQAFKFGQTVFDLTMNADGLWIVASREGDARQQITSAGANAGNLIRQWLKLIAGASDPSEVVTEISDSLLTTGRMGDGGTIICQIDRRTLTARQYTLKDAGGKTQFTLSLGRYIQSGGSVWPTRIEAVSETGRILIELSDVEINAGLPPAALKPPASAERLP